MNNKEQKGEPTSISGNSTKPIVVGQSKQLKAFYLWVDDNYALGSLTDKVDMVVEEYLKSL